jgi:hypothetical protein
MSQKDNPQQGVVANSLNGARGKRCDIDGQAEGRVSGSERVNLFRNGGVGFIDWLGSIMLSTLSPIVNDLSGENPIVDTATPLDCALHQSPNLLPPFPRYAHTL